MINSIEDFKKIIDKSKEILIVSSEDSIDSIVSSLSIYYLLENKNKNVTLFSKKQFPEKISFLPRPIRTIDNLNGLRDFQLIFNTSQNKITRLEKEENGSEYIISITPEKGAINPRDFSFIPSKFKFDLIIILGLPSLKNLDSIYLENTDLFFEVPKINIDNDPKNEQYGQINLVKETASSISEILAELILENYSDLVDKKISQSLLTGIIAATESFQVPTVSPKAMLLSAQLMKNKADQTVIVQHLYRTKPLSFIKLLGRIMARLHWDKDKKIIWSLVSQEDFSQSASNQNDLPSVLEEIQKSFPQNQTCLIIYTNSKNQTFGLAKTIDEEKMRILKDIFDAEQTKQNLQINFGDKNLIEAEKIFFEKIVASDF